MWYELFQGYIDAALLLLLKMQLIVSIQIIDATSMYQQVFLLIYALRYNCYSIIMSVAATSFFNDIQIFYWRWSVVFNLILRVDI